MEKDSPLEVPDPQTPGEEESRLRKLIAQLKEDNEDLRASGAIWIRLYESALAREKALERRCDAVENAELTNELARDGQSRE